MALVFTPDRWTGNQWASIEIDPAEHHYQVFLPLLQYLATTYGFEVPVTCPMLDGYAADFCLNGSEGTLFLDNWGMSLAFEHEPVRDLVLTQLQALPADFFLT
ncbi:hypothetical protein [Hymenobacter jeollabukensis]|uniref:Uncharacterized protein n=1 Tax=Hymenobacter jeollabukensis TaxID=2025313 RepID=A0A5R8WVK9_9BACT|nr:hypothetical protein [Hymenobacter jeollabukensis]TLM96560.1 hypothetical protein FDY95_00770 [Hymenobacter jeollabukensis]